MWSPYSTTQTFTQPLCLAPTQLMFSKYSNGDHKIEWTGASLFIKYQVRYRELGTSAWTTVGTTPGLNHKRLPASAMEDGITYEVRVRTLCNTASPTSKNVWSYYSPYYNYTPQPARLGQRQPALVSQALYPNPASKFVYVNLAGDMDEYMDVEVVDLQGKTMRRMNGMGGEVVQIHINDLPNGVYVVRVSNGKTQQNYKFVKQ